MNEKVNEPKSETGADDVRWDLSDLYQGLDDPALDRDVERFMELAEQFGKRHRGNLESTLGESLEDQAVLRQLGDKLMVYLMLRRSTDATNAEIERRIAQAQERFSRAYADHINFFEHELVEIADDEYEKALAASAVAARHRPYLDHLRANRQYLLSEEVERALTLRSPYGPSEWSEYINELEAELRFELDGETLNLPQLLHVASNDVAL